MAKGELQKLGPTRTRRPSSSELGVLSLFAECEDSDGVARRRKFGAAVIKLDTLSAMLRALRAHAKNPARRPPFAVRSLRKGT